MDSNTRFGEIRSLVPMVRSGKDAKKLTLICIQEGGRDPVYAKEVLSPYLAQALPPFIHAVSKNGDGLSEGLAPFVDNIHTLDIHPNKLSDELAPIPTSDRVVPHIASIGDVSKKVIFKRAKHVRLSGGDQSIGLTHIESCDKLTLVLPRFITPAHGELIKCKELHIVKPSHHERNLADFASLYGELISSSGEVHLIVRDMRYDGLDREEYLNLSSLGIWVPDWEYARSLEPIIRYINSRPTPLPLLNIDACSSALVILMGSSLSGAIKRVNARRSDSLGSIAKMYPHTEFCHEVR